MGRVVTVEVSPGVYARAPWHVLCAPRLPTPRARARTDALVIHESVTRDAGTTYRVLQRRGLSVHLGVEADGTIVQWAPLDRRCAHAGDTLNATSIGVELTNPYYPRLLRAGDPWTAVIDAPWAQRGRYVVPTLAQLEATAQLVAWLTLDAPESVRVPMEWPGLDGSSMRMGRVTGARRGIVAHTYVGHADGAFPTLYAWLRLHRQLEPEQALRVALRAATGRRVAGGWA